MVIFNSLIIYKATQFQRAQRVSAASTSAAAAASIRRKAEMTRTVFTITVFYILSSIPNTIAAGYYLSILQLPTGQMIANLSNGFQATYQAFNFFILYFSNKLFAKEVKSLFCDMGVRFGLSTQASKAHPTAVII